MPSDALASANESVARECRVFCRYLVGEAPDEHIKRKYADAVARVPELRAPQGGFEGLLLSLASLHPLLTRAVDTYARFFRPGALVRKRLVLMFAILESWGRTTHHFDDSSAGGPLGFLAGLVLAGLRMVLLLGIAALVLLPLQWLMPAGTGAPTLKDQTP